MNKVKFLTAILAVFFVQSCALSDIRTNYLKGKKPTYTLIKKGKILLNQSINKHNYSEFKKFETYEAVITDHWDIPFADKLSPWEDYKEKMNIKYIPNTFDGQYKVLGGKKEGNIYGIQSWKNYIKEKGKTLKFLEKNDPNLEFILPTMQYFFELPGRLANAELIAYAGEKKANNQNYDLVFISWRSYSPNEKNDQYLLWINQKTKITEYITYTIRDLPIRNAYGTIHYSNFKEINKVLIPFEMTVYSNEEINSKKYLHQVNVKEFKFNSFSKEKLYPNKSLKKYGDSKPN